MAVLARIATFIEIAAIPEVPPALLFSFLPVEVEGGRQAVGRWAQAMGGLATGRQCGSQPPHEKACEEEKAATDVTAQEVGHGAEW